MSIDYEFSQHIYTSPENFFTQFSSLPYESEELDFSHFRMTVFVLRQKRKDEEFFHHRENKKPHV